jgi:hypothetical protein
MESDRREAPRRDSPRVRSRRFTILDGLIMIVPMAVGIVLARPFVDDFLDRLRIPDNTPWWFRHSGLVIGLASRFVATELIGLFVAGLLPPRQTPRRLSRQPGIVAVVAATAAMVAGGLIVVSLSLFRRHPISSADEYSWPFFEARIFPAISAAWIIQALTGRWRPESNWIDRAGRVLGAYWIILWLYRHVMAYIWPGYWIDPR